MTKNEKIKGDNVRKNIASKWGEMGGINVLGFLKFLLREKCSGWGVNTLWNQFSKNMEWEDIV